ncbi:hypothetical protein IQ235_12420 [Oscillatoriales cyanobacterium LEGE 11467]|uniref:Uncharacterized protein n=1 Tax=Zarconia navalis LEGE 11467 TaxID=1828826 RepID=A0A928W1J9_9CYAN|nr:hypothetical protein [Zarconia navalis]MBE9041585.1 hypothetical protein [Zarconia navalis LEGE 11467]
MNTDFDFQKKDLFGPVIFRPEFNNFEKIDTNNAWSLFFTGGKEDKALGFSRDFGYFFNNTLIAIVVAGTIWGLFFSNLPSSL